MKKRVRATVPSSPDRRAVLYARVSSKDQEREGFSIDAQVKLLREYAVAAGFDVAREFVDVETAKESGRTAFGAMLAYLRKKLGIRTLLVEKTDRRPQSALVCSRSARL